MAGDRAEFKKRKQPTGGRLSHGSKKHKGRDLGRNEHSRQRGPDRRQGGDEHRNAPLPTVRGKENVLPKPFSEAEIAQEERRPKHKVAVMIGYSGTGYRGMQINTSEKTIEGDLFTAFVKAGAISKANANDPKKSQLVRCARTDKGVHAAGNVISLKLIIEDEDIVQKINDNLPEQIRVWGIERTVNSFSAYQACDSRWYEYLIPSHAFLSPHPHSHLAKRLAQLAEEKGDSEEYRKRQADAVEYWERVEEAEIRPILDTLEPTLRARVAEALFSENESSESLPEGDEEGGLRVAGGEGAEGTRQPAESEVAETVSRTAATDGTSQSVQDDVDTLAASAEDKQKLTSAARRLKRAYIKAKRAYRIPKERLDRIQPVLDAFLGTQNFHNYTVNKTFKDPSAKRVIKSFELNSQPITINGTEWLSIKIHGQSFMMHQIRKMIGMVSLVVRSGCEVERVQQSFGPDRFNIPKVPGLGLLLEAPVFQSYNEGPATQFERATLDFKSYANVMDEFKEREIYQRIFREEEESNAFHTFYAHIDHLRESNFLYLSSMGFAAVSKYAPPKAAGNSRVERKPQTFESDDDEAGSGEG